MKAIGSNIVVEVQEKSKPAPGTIVFPDPLEADGLEKATIVSVGSEIKEELGPGDQVLIYLGHGKKFTCPEDSKPYRSINISEILIKL